MCNQELSDFLRISKICVYVCCLRKRINAKQKRIKKWHCNWKMDRETANAQEEKLKRKYVIMHRMMHIPNIKTTLHSTNIYYICRRLLYTTEYAQYANNKRWKCGCTYLHNYF